LLLESFIEKGGISNQRIGDRDISDHCPIWLECWRLNWGPEMFKFLNCWLQHPEFNSFVKDTWDSTIIRGNSAFILKEKMKSLKEALKNWNREVFGIVDLNIEKTVKELNDIEELIANDVCDPNQLNSKELVKQFWDRFILKIVFSDKNPERSGTRKVILILVFSMLVSKPGVVEIRLCL
jgi:hypothetical protein